jgi:hypothetical protein
MSIQALREAIATKQFLGVITGEDMGSMSLELFE